MIRFVGFLLALAFFARQAIAQNTADSTGSGHPAAASLELWAGYSPGSRGLRFLGQHDGITLGLAGVRLNTRIRASDRGSLYYTFDAIPLARVTPLILYNSQYSQNCAAPKFDCVRESSVARGVGFNPLGLTMVYRARQPFQWRVGANAGMLVFDRPAPSDISTRFNFTAAIEGGVQWVRHTGTGVTLVYRLHHLSNAGLGEDNLAILSHVISLGWIWRTGTR